MRDLKFFLWIIPYIGLILCIIALFTPAAYFENVIWNHQIINWIWGLYQDTFNSVVTTGFFVESIRLLPSIISSSIIVLSIIVCGILLILSRKNLKKGLVKSPIFIIPALSIVSSLIYWMVMLEIAEQTLYDISMWERYIPGFGVIGLFLGACLILIGTLLTKYNKSIVTKEKH